MATGVHGHVAEGFEDVEQAFRENFAVRGELGAAFAAHVHGHKVVDLWGGVADADHGTPWSEDTAVMIFSGTKGWVGLCMLLLLERGVLDLEAPVGHYWPEFSRNDKREVRVWHVLGHLAGLPGIRTPITNDQMVDDRQMALLLEGQALLWPSGIRIAYHPLTYGWICGELVRRIDGRSIGRMFAEDVARPLELDAWIGTPASAQARVAKLRLAESWSTIPPYDENDVAARMVYDNPPRRFAEPLRANSPAYRAAEVPASNGIATARSLARLYTSLALGGEIDGVRILGEDTVRLGRRGVGRGPDAFTSRPLAFGIGFGLQTRQLVLGPAVSAFGASGAGGSVQGAWPDEGVGFAYVMNDLRNHPDDARSTALLDALYFAVRTHTAEVTSPTTEGG